MIKSVHHKYGTIIDPPSGWKYGFPKHLPDSKDYKEMLSYFDDFNDMKASSRIVNYIETNEI